MMVLRNLFCFHQLPIGKSEMRSLIFYCALLFYALKKRLQIELCALNNKLFGILDDTVDRLVDTHTHMNKGREGTD